MASSSRASDSSSSRSKRLDEDQTKETLSNLVSSLTTLKQKIQASRSLSIKEKLEKNMRGLRVQTARLLEAGTRRAASEPDMLLARLENPLCRINGWDSSKEMAEHVNLQEESPSMLSVTFGGGNGGGRSVVRLVMLPLVERIPPYTTWIFLDRNQRMAEDQSVVGRRRIYYDPYGNETLICSDSDEEIPEPEEEKHEFTEGEDQILWKAIQEHGLNSEVLHILNQFTDASPDDIEERYETLMERYQEKQAESCGASEQVKSEQFLDRTISTALDSFDNLFCRRCLMFDCRLHGSQNLVMASERQPYGHESEENKKPCGNHCYLKLRDAQAQFPGMSSTADISRKESISLTERLDTVLALESEDSDPDNNASVTASDKMDTDANKLAVYPLETAETTKELYTEANCELNTVMTEVPVKVMSKRKALKNDNMLVGESEYASGLGSADKKQKIFSGPDISPNEDNELAGSSHIQRESVDESIGTSSENKPLCGDKTTKREVENSTTKDNLVKTSSNRSKALQSHGWSTMEKDLYVKGIEIFGKNSCLIARNLLAGFKTCMEVSQYMFSNGDISLSKTLSSNHLEDSENAHDYSEQDMPNKTRRRGKPKKLKYTWKSAGYPSIRKRIVDGKNQSCKQYTPCGCEQLCGKDCPCHQNGTCCEKYCGCSKNCKKRFRGCHCAKSQCRSRQCPCFAAGRECDPDVCKNCWVSCGDGTLGEPPVRGDGYQCGNMQLLLKQQQRILLGKSDVAGWGAFLKKPVNRNDYLGEYTGELISHKEADKRGKIYDRANSSFLFDLNDQYVLDAYRKGDKLKFANHSSNPNCYAKVMLVAGDHRVGIFAKERIEAGEELFYDYRYGPDQAPAWARKPEGSKRDDSAASHSRAHKAA